MEKVVQLSKDNIENIKRNLQNHKKRYCEVITIPDKIKFGIEIEFISPCHLDDIVKKASGTSYEFGYGVSPVFNILEAVSPKLTNRKETWNELSKILDIIKKNDAYIDDRIGAHIHFDNSIISDKNITTFLKLWYVFEEIIYQFSYGELDHLRDDAFLFANKLSNELKECLDSYEQGNKDLTIFSRFDKSYGINLYNHLNSNPIRYKNTYEIRCPNGTISKNVWQNNINFFAHLLLFGANKKNKQLICKYYSVGQFDNTVENAILLSELIFEEENDKLDFLKQYKLNLIDDQNEIEYHNMQKVL